MRLITPFHPLPQQRGGFLGINSAMQCCPQGPRFFLFLCCTFYGRWLHPKTGPTSWSQDGCQQHLGKNIYICNFPLCIARERLPFSSRLRGVKTQLFRVCSNPSCSLTGITGPLSSRFPWVCEVPRAEGLWQQGEVLLGLEHLRPTPVAEPVRTLAAWGAGQTQCKSECR